MEYDNNNQGVLFRNETATEENKQAYRNDTTDEFRK